LELKPIPFMSNFVGVVCGERWAIAENLIVKRKGVKPT